jgi:hypothetical protein
MRKERKRVYMQMQMRTRAGGKKWEIEVMVDNKGYEWIRTRRTKKCSSRMVVLMMKGIDQENGNETMTRTLKPRTMTMMRMMRRNLLRRL